MTNRKHWSEYDPTHIIYGYCKFGLGIYRIDPETYETIEFWLDYEVATEDEKNEYKKYLEEL